MPITEILTHTPLPLSRLWYTHCMYRRCNIDTGKYWVGVSAKAHSCAITHFNPCQRVFLTNSWQRSGSDISYKILAETLDIFSKYPSWSTCLESLISYCCCQIWNLAFLWRASVVFLPCRLSFKVHLWFSADALTSSMSSFNAVQHSSLWRFYFLKSVIDWLLSSLFESLP